MRTRPVYHASTDFDSRVNIVSRLRQTPVTQILSRCTHSRALFVALGFLAGIIYSLCF